MYRLKWLAPAVILSVLACVLSCQGPGDKPNGIREGFIEYRMEYQGDSLNHLEYLLPKKMKMYFKDNNTRNSISDLAGVVEFTHIKNQQKGTYTTLVDVFSNQYKYVEENNQGGPSVFFQSRPQINIQRTDEIKTIAGCSSRRYNIYYPDQDGTKREFPVYATKDIQIKGFTDLTPFHDIDGVLMEFQLQIYELPVKFTAIKVTSEEIPGEKFRIPAGYKQVNKQSMKKIMDLLK